MAKTGERVVVNVGSNPYGSPGPNAVIYSEGPVLTKGYGNGAVYVNADRYPAPAANLYSSRQGVYYEDPAAQVYVASAVKSKKHSKFSKKKSIDSMISDLESEEKKKQKAIEKERKKAAKAAEKARKKQESEMSSLESDLEKERKKKAKAAEKARKKQESEMSSLESDLEKEKKKRAKELEKARKKEESEMSSLESDLEKDKKKRAKELEKARKKEESELSSIESNLRKGKQASSSDLEDLVGARQTINKYSVSKSAVNRSGTVYKSGPAYPGTTTYKTYTTTTAYSRPVTGSTVTYGGPVPTTVDYSTTIMNGSRVSPSVVVTNEVKGKTSRSSSASSLNNLVGTTTSVNYVDPYRSTTVGVVPSAAPIIVAEAARNDAIIVNEVTSRNTFGYDADTNIVQSPRGGYYATSTANFVPAEQQEASLRIPRSVVQSPRQGYKPVRRAEYIQEKQRIHELYELQRRAEADARREGREMRRGETSPRMSRRHHMSQLTHGHHMGRHSHAGAVAMVKSESELSSIRSDMERDQVNMYSRRMSSRSSSVEKDIRRTNMTMMNAETMRREEELRETKWRIAEEEKLLRRERRKTAVARLTCCPSRPEGAEEIRIGEPEYYGDVIVSPRKTTEYLCCAGRQPSNTIQTYSYPHGMMAGSELLDAVLAPPVGPRVTAVSKPSRIQLMRDVPAASEAMISKSSQIRAHVKGQKEVNQMAFAYSEKLRHFPSDVKPVKTSTRFGYITGEMFKADVLDLIGGSMADDRLFVEASHAEAMLPMFSSKRYLLDGPNGEDDMGLKFELCRDGFIRAAPILLNPSLSGHMIDLNFAVTTGELGSPPGILIDKYSTMWTRVGDSAVKLQEGFRLDARNLVTGVRRLKAMVVIATCAKQPEGLDMLSTNADIARYVGLDTGLEKIPEMKNLADPSLIHIVCEDEHFVASRVHLMARSKEFEKLFKGSGGVSIVLKGSPPNIVRNLLQYIHFDKCPLLKMPLDVPAACMLLSTAYKFRVTPLIADLSMRIGCSITSTNMPVVRKTAATVRNSYLIRACDEYELASIRKEMTLPMMNTMSTVVPVVPVTTTTTYPVSGYETVNYGTNNYGTANYGSTTYVSAPAVNQSIRVSEVEKIRLEEQVLSNQSMVTSAAVVEESRRKSSSSSSSNRQRSNSSGEANVLTNSIMVSQPATTVYKSNMSSGSSDRIGRDDVRTELVVDSLTTPTLQSSVIDIPKPVEVALINEVNESNLVNSSMMQSGVPPRVEAAIVEAAVTPPSYIEQPTVAQKVRAVERVEASKSPRSSARTSRAVSPSVATVGHKGRDLSEKEKLALLKLVKDGKIRKEKLNPSELRFLEEQLRGNKLEKKDAEKLRKLLL